MPRKNLHLTLLYAIGMECELWKSKGPNPEFFATIDRGTHTDHVRLPLKVGKSKFRNWLADRFQKKVGHAASADALSQALSSLNGHAQEQGAAYDACIRVAAFGEALYLDLANEKGEVVEITKAGYKVIKDPPVRFIRGTSRKPLPTPEKGGSIRDFYTYLNINPDAGEMELKKIVAWMICAFRPEFPFIILMLTGESGTAKTTACRFLIALVDPVVAPARGLPKTEDDLIVAASHNWVMTADNVSGISAEMADAICRMSTGGGNSKRELYSDGEEYVREVKRPFILTCINVPTSRQDLLSRSVLVELQPISTEARKEETKLLAAFEADRPKLLGVLLDGLVAALGNLEKLQGEVKELPRMADAALFAAAAMPAFEWGDYNFPGIGSEDLRESHQFLTGYAEMQEQVIAEAAESDAVLVAIRDWIKGRTEPGYEQTCSDLLNILNSLIGERTKDAAWRSENQWPKSASALSRRLTFGASGLRAMGVGYERCRDGRSRVIRLWRGEKPEFKPTTEDQAKLIEQDCAQVEKERQKQIEEAERIGRAGREPSEM